MKHQNLRFSFPMGGLICVLLAALLSGAPSCRFFQPRMFSQSRFLLDTIVEITVVSKNQREAMAAMTAAYDEIARIEALLSKYVADSQISAINQHAGEEQAVQVDPEVVAIVQRSLGYTARTDGTFNMALGAVIDLWGIGTDHEHVPEQTELHNALQLTAADDVEIKGQNVRLAKSGMSIDLGGIAKGYSIDQAFHVLQQHDIQHALLNAGGDIRCLGTKPDGSPWRIGIQHPRESGILGVVELQDAAITTSGDYERFFIQDDASSPEEVGASTHKEVRYHHLFDPQSGRPARGCQSVTILTDTAEAADVYSTAVFIMGPEQGLTFIEQNPDLEGMIVRADGEILTSSGFTYIPAQ